jgi:hypothetical protein
VVTAPAIPGAPSATVVSVTGTGGFESLAFNTAVVTTSGYNL